MCSVWSKQREGDFHFVSSVPRRAEKVFSQNCPVPSDPSAHQSSALRMSLRRWVTPARLASCNWRSEVCYDMHMQTSCWLDGKIAYWWETTWSVRYLKFNKIHFAGKDGCGYVHGCEPWLGHCKYWCIHTMKGTNARCNLIYQIHMHNMHAWLHTYRTYWHILKQADIISKGHYDSESEFRQLIQGQVVLDPIG